MERLSQLTSQLARIQSQPGSGNATPRQTDHGFPATTYITNMAKTKVVVTRQLIDEAQTLLDERKYSLEIVQWRSEKASQD